MESRSCEKLFVSLPAKAGSEDSPACGEPSPDHGVSAESGGGQQRCWTVEENPYFEAYNRLSKAPDNVQGKRDNDDNDNQREPDCDDNSSDPHKAGHAGEVTDAGPDNGSLSDKIKVDNALKTTQVWTPGHDTNTDSESVTATDGVSNTFEDEGSEAFECGICTDDLSVPKSLPCLHNFCLDCLEKYFRVNQLSGGQTFSCPTCRATVAIPQGGANSFPTNFHIEKLRRQSRELDLGLTIKDAVRYLECRAEEIVDELTERKRQVLIRIGRRQESLVNRIDDVVVALQDSVDEQYTLDATKAVDIIRGIKLKLCELESQLCRSTRDVQAASSSPGTTRRRPIRLNALSKLRRQAEIITNVNNELEELKAQADRELSNILEIQATFCPGRGTTDALHRIVGKILLVREGQVPPDMDSDDSEHGTSGLTNTTDGGGEETFSPLHVRSWSQSWWVLLFAVLPAVLCALLIKMLMAVLEKFLD